MSNEIIKQLLNEILDLQERLVEERQENKNLEKDLEKYKNCMNYLEEKNREQEKRKKDEVAYAFFIGVGFTIFFYLLIKFFLYYFF